MIWLNGTICPPERAISAQDRGLLLGESVFETLLVKRGIPQFWQAHIDRLLAAAAAFDLACPYDKPALKRAAQELLAQETSPSARQILRITLTGGDGGRGLVPAAPTTPNLMMQLSPTGPAPEALYLADCSVLRLAGQASTAHKTGNYVDNILARREAMGQQADEAVMRNQYGRIAGAAAGNIFAAFGKHLITPPVSDGALPGTVRQALLAQSRVGPWQITEGLIEADRLRQADALFVTNSLNGVVAAFYGPEKDTTQNEAQKKQGSDMAFALAQALPESLEF